MSIKNILPALKMAGIKMHLKQGRKEGFAATNQRLSGVPTGFLKQLIASCNSLVPQDQRRRRARISSVCITRVFAPR